MLLPTLLVTWPRGELWLVQARPYLAPPMPPVITGGSRLRRGNSSTLSLNKTKKKLLTVEELYVEVLYTVLHMIGCDIDQVAPWLHLTCPLPHSCKMLQIFFCNPFKKPVTEAKTNTSIDFKVSWSNTKRWKVSSFPEKWIFLVKHVQLFQVNETELIKYVQEAFHMEQEKHQQLLEIATMKEVRTLFAS